MIRHKVGEKVEDLWLQRDDLAIAPELIEAQVEFAIDEPVNHVKLDNPVLPDAQRNSRKFLEYLQENFKL